MERVVIIAAKRTAIGKFGGQFRTLSAVDLGVACLKGLLAAVPGGATQVDQVLLGNVLSAGLGQNPARLVAQQAGLAPQVTATTVNDVCGSSLKAMRFAQLTLAAGAARAIVVGGIESMSQAPFLLARPEKRQPVDRAGALTDSLFHDGLTDTLTEQAMGAQVEAMAQEQGFTRAQQDQYAVLSHEKATAATAAGRFQAEIVPVTVGDQAVTRDESIRPQTTLAALAQLPAAFAPAGTITAGNSSPLNDGASMVFLTTEREAQAQNWPIAAYLGEFSEVGAPSPQFGTTPIAAVQAVLAQARLSLAAIDVVELNEAFAAQALAVQTALQIPAAKLNPTGGALALGHPLAASGTRLVTTLLSEMGRRDLRNGLVTLCIGGGQGIAWRLYRE
ncbi:thiolase family protein [Lapidilactobacillus salsurivasis]